MVVLVDLPTFIIPWKLQVIPCKLLILCFKMIVNGFLACYDLPSSLAR